MFRTLRRGVGALEALNKTLGDLLVAQAESGPALERLELLELSRAQWEAEMEGLYLKAEGKAKAASAAEARERTMRKSYEHLIDPFADDSEEVPPALLERYDPPSEEGGLQPVHVGVAEDYKATALRAKFQ